jgi:hypothetical protein
VSKIRDALKTPIYKPRNWGIPTPGKQLPEPWYGLDTERDSKSGKFVCGWIADTKREQAFNVIQDLPPATYWIWNLGYDIAGMIRDLGKNEGWAMREDGTRFTIQDASCVYFHGKRFEWKDSGGTRLFLEASSFFNRIALKEAAKTLCVCKCEPCRKHKKEPLAFQHCGSDEAKCPMKDPVDASKMSLNRFEVDRKYREIVNRYCAKDARIAFRLMDYLRIGFLELGEKLKWTEPLHIGGTPGSTARRLLRNISPYPDVLWQTLRPFQEAYCGGRFEITRRGVMFDAKQYDKVSAYPWAQAQLPMLTKTASHVFTRRLDEASLYGAYEVGFKTDEYFGIMPGYIGNTRVYSKAEKRGWITKPELMWLSENGYDYTIHRGVEIHDPNWTHGWRDAIVPIFNMKQAGKGTPAGLGAKVGVNSSYGITVQLIRKGGIWEPITEGHTYTDFAGTLGLLEGPRAYEAGQLAAFAYGATLTAMVRVDLIDTAKIAGEENVVAFHTDSLLLKDGASIPVGEKLGDWSLEESAPELIILKTGQYAIGDKVKGRGFSKRKLDPNDEHEIARRHKEDLWAPKQMKRAMTGVKTAKSWDEVSLIREKKVANNIGWEHKRRWIPTGFGEREILRMLQRREWQDSEALAGVGKAA